MASMLDLGQNASNMFAVMAQHRLMAALREAFLYILTVAAQRHPRWLLRLHAVRDELFIALAGALEAYTLAQHKGSFAEHFYGMRREWSDRARPSAQLRVIELALLLVPLYARAKLDPVFATDEPLWHEAGGGGDVAVERDGTCPSTARLALRLLYRLGCFVSEAAELAQLLLYCAGRSPHATLTQRMLGFCLAPAPAALAPAALVASDSSVATRVIAALQLPLHHARHLIVLSLFGYRLAETWHSPLNAPPPPPPLIPPPPPPPPVGDGPLEIMRDAAARGSGHVCAVCAREPLEPTASSSGYVMCARCVGGAVERRGVCPLTGQRTTAAELIRLYETSRPTKGQQPS